MVVMHIEQAQLLGNLIFMVFFFVFQINYFPSRIDPTRHAERYPQPSAVYTGKRERVSDQYKYLLNVSTLTPFCLLLD